MRGHPIGRREGDEPPCSAEGGEERRRLVSRGRWQLSDDGGERSAAGSEAAAELGEERQQAADHIGGAARPRVNAPELGQRRAQRVVRGGLCEFEHEAAGWLA